MSLTNEWHNLAYLYLYRGLELHEIVKTWHIMSVAGFIKDKELYNTPGYGVLDNRELFEGMVYSIIKAMPDERILTHDEMAEILHWSRPTVSKTVNAIAERGLISYERKGSIYTILSSENIPLWLITFGQAIVDVYTNKEIRAEVDTNLGDIKFIRGWQVLWEELKQLRPRKTRTTKSASDAD